MSNSRTAKRIGTARRRLAKLHIANINPSFGDPFGERNEIKMKMKMEMKMFAIADKNMLFEKNAFAGNNEWT